MLLVVFLKVMSFYLIFKKKVWMKSSVIFSSKKSIAHKKKQALQLSTQQLPKSFFSRQKPVFYVDLPFILSYKI